MNTTYPGAALSADERRQSARRLDLALLASGLFTLGLSWTWYAPAQSDIGQMLLGSAALIVSLPVLRAAWHSLRHPDLHGVTDLLIGCAMIAAWAVGDLITAVLLPVVMIIGHALEERSVIGSQEAIAALGRLTRSMARRLRADGSVEEVDNEALRPGDQVEVRAGDRVPADGRVLEGRASLDTAPITGESVPLEARTGSDIYGGAIALDGRLRVEVTRSGEDSTLGRVIALMQSAERSKPPITRLLERHAGTYLVLVLLIAAVTYFGTLDPQAMLAVLVAACPCALALAAPATAVAGIAVAARHGILIRGSAFLEELADTDTLIVDKTGTLTLGALWLQELRCVDDDAGDLDREACLALAAALARTSTHPVSRALVQAVAPGTVLPPLGGEPSERAGLGLVAESPALGTVVLGRAELLEASGVALPPIPAHEGPIAGLAVGGRFRGWFLLADRLRPESAAALADLRALGLTHQVLLSGDRAAVAQQVAAQLGIDRVQAQALPEEKLRRVLAETAAGRRPMVVGDGINDSLALKAGAVGVAMGAGGSDIALASADIVLVGGDLRRLGSCIRLSRRCRRTLFVNVLVGLGWTLGIVLAAALGWLGGAGAMIAALLHNLSTLLVLANAGRLLRFHEPLH